MGCRSTNCAVYSVTYRLILCSMYRRRVVTGGVDVRLKEIVWEVVAEVAGTVIEVEVMPDHVHLLAEIPPSVALPVLMQSLKGRSSGLLGQQFRGLGGFPSLWSRSWFVSTVGGAPVEVVRRYVENQRLAA